MAWTITDAGVLPSGTRGNIRGISDDGTTAVGDCLNSGAVQRAIRQPGTVAGSGLWSTNGAMVDLGLPTGATSSTARAVSQTNGVIAGFATMTVDNNNPHAFVNIASVWSDLGNGSSPPPHPSQGANAFAVSSDGGKVAGKYQTTPGSNALIWTQSGGGVLSFVEITPPAGSVSLRATSISRDGTWAAGFYVDVNGRPQNFTWNASPGFVSIGQPSTTLAGQDFDAFISTGGTYVATSHTLSATGKVHGFRWTNGVWTDIGLLPGGSQAQVTAITPDGLTIVGLADDALGVFHAFIWTSTTGMRQLPDLSSGKAANAYCINSAATLVGGTALTSGSAQHAVVWSLVTVGGGTPVAPPSVKVADLWFGSTGAFVDMTLVANRRKFISAAGGAQSLAVDGSSPFQRKPSIFLTVPTGGTPSQFATNFGNGGTFVVSGGALATATPAPPGTSNSVTTTKAPSLGVGVLGDYRNGNLYAFNMDTLTDNGAERRWLRSWRAFEKPPDKPVRNSSLQVDMETGSATNPTAGKPQVVLRWSDDGGMTWSDPRILAAGPVGAVAQNVRATRLGSTRRFSRSDRIYELSSTDQFKVAIIGAEIEVS